MAILRNSNKNSDENNQKEKSRNKEKETEISKRKKDVEVDSDDNENNKKKNLKSLNKKENEKVECIAVKYTIPLEHPNYFLDGRIDRVAISEIIGFGDKISKEDVRLV